MELPVSATRLRNSPGDGTVDFEPARQCYRARVSIGKTPDGKLRRLVRRFYLRDYPTPKKAERAAWDWIEETRTLHRRGTLLEPATATLAEWTEEFLASSEARGRARKTLADYRDYLSRFAVAELGHLRLSELTPAAIESWVNRLYRRGVGRYSVWKAHHYLKMALKRAVDLELLHRNPASRVRVERPPEAEYPRWSPDEVRRVLAYCRQHEHPLWAYVHLGLTAGLRREELLGLRWARVNSAGGYLEIVEALTYVRGRPIFGPPKTRRKRRVYLDAETLERLEWQRQRVAAMRAAARGRWREHDLVFPSPTGGPMNESRFSVAFAELCRAAGVSRIRPYDLRSTNVSLSEGKILEYVGAAKSGHSETVRRRHYKRALDEQLKQAALSIEELLS